MPLPPGPSAPAAIQTARWLIQPVQLMEACRRRYGDSFTLSLVGGRKPVLISAPADVGGVLASDAANTPTRGRQLVMRPVFGPRSVFLQTGQDHQDRRRMIGPTFSPSRLARHQGLIEQIVAREVQSWPVGRPFALHPRMRAITLEAILGAVFGLDPSDPRSDPIRRLSELAGTSLAYQLAGAVTRRLRLPGPHRTLERTLGAVNAALAAEISNRREDPRPKDAGDVLSALLEARDEGGRRMEDSELRDQLVTLLLAGHETTATGLAWCFDLLLQNPQELDRLRAELNAGDDDSYLDAVVQEALRLRPVVPTTGRRLGAPAEISGRQVPAGTEVVIAIWLLHTHPDIHPDPYRFHPGRFLDDRSSSRKWLSFGGGARRCLGAAFAMAEMKTVLRTVLRSVELRPARRAADRIVRRNVTFAPRHGTSVVVEDRL